MIESFKLPNITPEALTGSIVSFNDEYGNLPLKSCTSLISGYQEGSGIPSPDNVRPIVGFTQANIVNMSDITNKAYFDGLLNGTYGFVDLGSLSWALQTSHRFQAYNVISAKPTGSYDVASNCVCSEYATLTQNQVYAENTGIAIHALNGMSIYVWDARFDDAVTFNTAMSGVYLIYERAEPSTPVTPEQFATLCQAFGITGNTYTFTFGQSIYQGSIDWEKGVVRATWSYIASYNGETLTGEWLCDKAPYEAGTTPPTGSQVAYELATPIEIPLGGIQLLTQQGVNNIFCDTGDTEVTHLKVT